MLYYDCFVTMPEPRARAMSGFSLETHPVKIHREMHAEADHV